jgi:TPR repeat protein
MKAIAKSICILLMFWLGISPTWAATAATAKANAKVKAVSKAKAGVKVKTKASIKAKTKAKEQAKKKAKEKAKPKSSAKAPQPGLAPGAAPGPGIRVGDEAALDAEVAAARRKLAASPGDIAARERLAQIAVARIDLLLAAEAVGDIAKAERLSQKIAKELYDTGSGVLKLSQKGDPRVRQAAGVLLGRGLLLQKDTVKSCAEFLVAAEALAPAGWHAAQCLMEAEPEKALALMERAALKGHAAALEWMGRRCLGEFGSKQKDFACARDYLAQSASLGRPRAQTLLAYLLTSGQGGPADVSRAARLYKLAAEQGDADAQNNLGEIHEMGRGVDRNLDQAIRWYERAAERGLGSAQFNAGRLWAIGVGEKKDPAKARAFLVQAEGNGVPQARQVLEWLDNNGLSAADPASMQKPAAAAEGDGKRQ